MYRHIGYQKIEFNEYFTPDGQRIALDGGDYALISETGLGMPPIRHISQASPFQHGETIYDYRLEPRIIQLVLRGNSCSRAEYWNKRSAIIDALRPNRQISGRFDPGVFRKILPNGAIRDIKVFLQEGPAFQPRDSKEWDEWGFTDTIRFIAPDPVFYDPEEQTYSISTTQTAQLILPFSFDGTDMAFSIGSYLGTLSLNYPGTWRSYPKFVLSGPLTGFAAQHIELGMIISMSTYTLIPGEIVTISLEEGNKYVVSSLNGNIMAYIDSNSDFSDFHIAGHPEANNGNNTIAIYGIGTYSYQTVIAMNYIVRYIGI